MADMANTRLNFIVFRDNNGRMIFNFKGMLMKKYIPDFIIFFFVKMQIV